MWIDPFKRHGTPKKMTKQLVSIKRKCCNKPSSSLSSQNSTNQPQQSSKFSKKLSNRLNISWSRSKRPINVQKSTNLIKKEPKSRSACFCFDIKNWFRESKHQNVNTLTIDPSIIYHCYQCKSVNPCYNCSITSKASKRLHNNISKSPCRHCKYNLNSNSQQKYINHSYYMERCKSRLN